MNSASFQIASLYVGDLHPDVTESMLLNKFSSVVQVYSIRLCRDKTTGKSLRYAFVNFQQRADAERAMEQLNFDSLLGQPMRIMWSQRDASLRQSNMGNIFIKNLEKSIDSETLYNTFSSFGKILSCKVAYDKNGPRGFGYVHFERAQDAKAAIKRLNGMLLNGHKVLITHFKSRQEREAVNKTAEERVVPPTVPATAPEIPAEAPSAVKIAVPTGANTAVKKAEPPSVPTAASVSLYVGDLHPHVTESMLLNKFSSVVQVNSVHLCRDKTTGKSLQYAFVNFEQRADAEHAMELLNFDSLLGQPMRIMWSQRDSSLRQSNVGNVFIKNLVKSVDSATLYNIFSRFGKILSCKVACDKNGPRGFGYVHFERAQDAEAAIKRLNGTLLNGRNLLITRFKSRQEREAVNNTAEEKVVPPTVPATAGNASAPEVPAEAPSAVKIAVPTGANTAVKKAEPTSVPIAALVSVYVGDLHPRVTESMLLKKFSSVVEVNSVHLCRDKTTGKSLRYAFVNFEQRTDAERAMEQLNFDSLLGQPMRIMWSQRDSSLRQSNVGNIFIKNLEKSVDSVTLYNIFSSFGKILSCKVACDKNGPRGFGYVHFERAQDAEAAIKRLNGTLLNGRNLLITRFKSRQEREAVNNTAEENVVPPTVPAAAGNASAPEVPAEAPSAVKIAVPTGANTAVKKAEPTSVPTAESVSLYVGDLHPHVTESMLLNKFSSVVQVNSVHLCRDKTTGKSLQYAFVNFQKRANAEHAMEQLNFDRLLGQPMRIMWSQSDSSLRQSNVGNVFIKNLVKSVDSATLYNIFSGFGKILSCKVACDKNGPRGFGYVQFERAQDAEAAIKRLNGTLLRGRKLLITHFKSRQEREAVNKTAKEKVVPTVRAAVPTVVNIGIPANGSTTVKKAEPAERKGMEVKKTVRQRKVVNMW